jgi:phosphoglycolate phosphatase
MIDGIVIFDLDGTLFRTETISVPAVREAFELHGLAPPDDAAICSMFGKRSGSYRAFLRERCPDDRAEAVEAHALRRELELAGEGGELYPGVIEALRDLRSGVRRLAICSNGPRRYVEAVLSAQGITGLFDAVRYRRPDDENKPQMMRELLSELGFAAPHRGVSVGDRADDIEAAHANGLLAIGAAYGYGADDELRGADRVIAAPEQLAEVTLEVLSRDPA